MKYNVSRTIRFTMAVEADNPDEALNEADCITWQDWDHREFLDDDCWTDEGDVDPEEA
jgi:hypothetical protein